MSVRVYFWNPLISTVTLYRPGRRNGTVYSPWLFVVAVAISPVSWLRTVIVAPGSAAWLESTTCPLTVARNSWAPTLPAMTSSRAAANRPRYDWILIISWFPPSAACNTNRVGTLTGAVTPGPTEEGPPVWPPLS